MLGFARVWRSRSSKSDSTGDTSTGTTTSTATSIGASTAAARTTGAAATGTAGATPETRMFRDARGAGIGENSAKTRRRRSRILPRQRLALVQFGAVTLRRDDLLRPLSAKRACQDQCGATGPLPLV
jgi:hypothetical protein